MALGIRVMSLQSFDVSSSITLCLNSFQSSWLLVAACLGSSALLSSHVHSAGHRHLSSWSWSVTRRLVWTLHDWQLWCVDQSHAYRADLCWEKRCDTQTQLGAVITVLVLRSHTHMHTRTHACMHSPSLCLSQPDCAITVLLCWAESHTYWCTSGQKVPLCKGISFVQHTHHNTVLTKVEILLVFQSMISVQVLIYTTGAGESKPWKGNLSLVGSVGYTCLTPSCLRRGAGSNWDPRSWRKRIETIPNATLSPPEWLLH